jgi:nicotinate dehydrogenase subunit B
MAPVVQQLAQLPEADVRAMAVYLASFNSASALVTQAAPAVPLNDPAHRLFTTACGACHHDGSGPELLGQNIPLALNTNLHSDRPDNLLRVILEGVREPASSELGFMPAFRDAFDDAQVAQLAAYMRQRFASEQPAWPDLEAASARVRASPSTH